ncbi:MAG: ABC transporter permease, partial [Blautia coccoides]
MNIIYFLIQQTMFFSIPLLIVALGGMFSERSGVINIALEGIMVMGAFISIGFINVFQDRLSGQGLFLLAFLVAAAAGAVFSLLHAFASVNLKADQTISGTALNMFAPAFALFMARMVQGKSQVPFTDTFHIEKVPVLGDIPVIGPMFFRNCYLSTYIGILIFIVASVLISRTRFGLRLRACGEHPQAADSVGINVYKIRYAGVLISG